MTESVTKNAASRRNPSLPEVVYIESGVCFVLFARDIARSINLERAEQRIHQNTERETIRHKRRAPSYFEYQPPPLRVTQGIEPLDLNTYRLEAGVDVILYDFGAMAVIYAIPIRGPFSNLLQLSEDLYDNQQLLSDSRRRAEHLLSTLGDAVTEGSITELVEDYIIFHINSLASPISTTDFCSQYGQQLAQILRAERQVLSEEEVEDALSARISFSTDDLTIIDWHAALLLDREGDDVRTVLEFANVELLEMRYLDQKMDRALDQAYEALSKRSWKLPSILGSYGRDLQRLAELQVDSAILFESVNNTLKLLGDQFLARVHRLVNKRFQLDQWDGSILRKLGTLESIYEKISDQAANRRMETLEWVIIILIAVSIGIELVRYFP